MQIVLAPPLVPHRRPRPGFSPLFLAHFDAVVVRASTPTLQLPDHHTYVLDTREGLHARSEVLLRRHGPTIVAVIAPARFPHLVTRLRPLLTMPVLDVRSTPAYLIPERPRAYLLDTPRLPAPHPLAALAYGWWVPAEALSGPTFVETWLPVLTSGPTRFVVLVCPWRGEERVLEALHTLRRTARPPVPSPRSGP